LLQLTPYSYWSQERELNSRPTDYEDPTPSFSNSSIYGNNLKLLPYFLSNESDFSRQKHILEQKSHPIPTQTVHEIGFELLIETRIMSA
jgi:hypothetical protein